MSLRCRGVPYKTASIMRKLIKVLGIITAIWNFAYICFWCPLSLVSLLLYLFEVNSTVSTSAYPPPSPVFFAIIPLILAILGCACGKNLFIFRRLRHIIVTTIATFVYYLWYCVFYGILSNEKFIPEVVPSLIVIFPIAWSILLLFICSLKKTEGLFSNYQKKNCGHLDTMKIY